MSSIRRSKRRVALAAAAVGFSLVAGPVAFTPGALADSSTRGPAGTVKVDLLAINDFHGQLETVAPDTRPGRQSNGEVLDGTTEVNAGGAAYLATHLQQLRDDARSRGSEPITVAAGDLIGATPLLSAAFHDEPTIEAMNTMGLQVSSVGNHEFDEGWRELRRMQDGGCLADGPDGANNQNSCPDPKNRFKGADFSYLAANVTHQSSGKTVLPPYWIKTVKGQKVAFIGMTLKNTPNIVTKEGVAGLDFADEVETVDKLVPVLKRQGAESIVVLLHQGLSPRPITDINGCQGVQANDPGLVLAKAFNPAVDVVVSGHTHQPYICTVDDPAGNPRLVTSAYSVGRVITDVGFEIDRATGDVVRSSVSASNHIVTNSDGTTPNAAITDLIARYKVLVAPIESKVLGQIAPADQRDTLSRTVDPNGRDSALGNLIADSQKLDPSTIPSGGTKPVVAFMNPGGIRADLAEDENNNVTYGSAFSVQPFNNYVVSMDLTGAQLRSVLNEQWNGTNELSNVVLQVSGLKYTFSTSRAAAANTDALEGDVLIDENGDGNVAEVLDPAKTYRVVVNSFLAGGGDGFPTLAQGGNVYFGGLDIDSLANHLAANNPYVPTATDRISMVP